MQQGHTYYYFVIIFLPDRVPTGTLYPTMQLAHVGSYASFKCSSATTPRLVVKWRDLFYNVVENIYTIENDLYEFVVHDLTEQDTGTYVCYGTHENQTFFTVESQLLVGGKLGIINYTFLMINFKWI